MKPEGETRKCTTDVTTDVTCTDDKSEKDFVNLMHAFIYLIIYQIFYFISFNGLNLIIIVPSEGL